ncbi:MAG: hypothetical protein WC389_15580, partial [Lutibacter sp.]
MKIKTCPECGSTLGSDCWTTGRKLMQRCDCGWKGEPRIPETLPIQDTKNVRVGQFWGYHYEIFDKYNHLLTSSRYYGTEKETLEEMQSDLTHSNKSPDMAPCKA